MDTSSHECTQDFMRLIRQAWYKILSSEKAYPAPEPDLIQQLCKCNVPGNTSGPDTKVATSLPQIQR